jgi:hypothetical protein
MKKLSLLLIMFQVACGPTLNISDCKAQFDELDKKVAQLVEGITTINEMKNLLGEPEMIYGDKEIQDYAYRVYSNKFCGQYRIYVNTSRNTVESIYSFKEF